MTPATRHGDDANETAALPIEGLSWISIIRLGLVQSALGAVVVLATSTLNRVMVVELSLAATIPGALVGLHYAVQLLRPLWGYGSDQGGRRTPWIAGGIALLALAGTLAALAILVMSGHFIAGLLLAILAFVLIGFGVGAAGTSLLALLATHVAPQRRAAAATIVWLMMIAGMVVTAIVAGSMLDPFSFQRLVTVTAAVGIFAFFVTLLAIWGVEGSARSLGHSAHGRKRAHLDSLASFRQALGEAWREPQARLFTIFVFVSMLAYNAQDLILEPFGGLVFGMTPGETTRLAGLQHAGVFTGMALAGILGSAIAKRWPPILMVLTVGGCLGSALALFGLALSARLPEIWPLKMNIMALGAANGVFAVAAIGSMMALAGQGRQSREGLRMGLWGAAQAIAFGLGGFGGTVAVDLFRLTTGEAASAYGTVFALEGGLFLLSSVLALRIAPASAATPMTGERADSAIHTA